MKSTSKSVDDDDDDDSASSDSDSSSSSDSSDSDSDSDSDSNADKKSVDSDSDGEPNWEGSDDMTLTAIVRTSVSLTGRARWLQKKPSASSKPEGGRVRKSQDRQVANRRKEKTVAPEKGGKEKGGRIYTRRLAEK